MPKSTEVALLEPMDTVKPLVKDFVDSEQDVISFVSLRLPHIANTTVAVKSVYANKDKTLFRFRANYWDNVQDEVSLVSTGKIVKSVYIEVRGTEDGFTFEDITGG